MQYDQMLFSVETVQTELQGFVETAVGDVEHPAQRGALLEPCANQGDATRVLRAVLAAAGQGAAEYWRLDGAVQTLHCGTAFDAGFVAGSQ